MSETVIDRLEQELWSQCVTQRVAEDDEAIKRWQADEAAHIRERFQVSPMKESTRPLVDEAVDEWERIEAISLKRMGGKTREQFLTEFTALREEFLRKKPLWGGKALSWGDIAYGAVKNMDWVNLFSWVLPQADPSHVAKHRLRGKMVTAVYYTEMLGKYGFSDEPNHQDILARIDARWKLLQE